MHKKVFLFQIKYDPHQYNLCLKSQCENFLQKQNMIFTVELDSSSLCHIIRKGPVQFHSSFEKFSSTLKRG